MLVVGLCTPALGGGPLGLAPNRTLLGLGPVLRPLAGLAVLRPLAATRREAIDPSSPPWPHIASSVRGLRYPCCDAASAAAAARALARSTAPRAVASAAAWLEISSSSEARCFKRALSRAPCCRVRSLSSSFVTSRGFINPSAEDPGAAVAPPSIPDPPRDPPRDLASSAAPSLPPPGAPPSSAMPRSSFSQRSSAALPLAIPKRAASANVADDSSSAPPSPSAALPCAALARRAAIDMRRTPRRSLCSWPSPSASSEGIIRRPPNESPRSVGPELGARHRCVPRAVLRGDASSRLADRCGRCDRCDRLVRGEGEREAVREPERRNEGEKARLAGRAVERPDRPVNPPDRPVKPPRSTSVRDGAVWPNEANVCAEATLPSSDAPRKA